MPKYEITDNVSGKTVVIEGDSPPSEQEAMQIFSDAGLRQKQPAVDGGGLSEDLKQRVLNIAGEMTPSGDETLDQSIINAPGRAFRSAGQVAGGINDIIGAGVGAILPEKVKQTIGETVSEIAQSPQYNPFVSGVVGAKEKFAKENPAAYKNIEAGANILSLLGIKGAKDLAKGTMKELSDFGKGISSTAKIMKPDYFNELALKTVSKIDDETERVVKKGIEKGIRPENAKTATASLRNNYFKHSKNAVEAIVNNKKGLEFVDNVTGETIRGKLPKTVEQFESAIAQTKHRIFNKYNEMVKTASGKGVTIKLNSAAIAADDIANNKVIRTMAPETARYAAKKAKELAGVVYSPEDAQEAIKILNQSLSSAKKQGASISEIRKAYVDAAIANNIRKTMDDVITKGAGPGYQEFKNLYGSLLEIEKDVGRRVSVANRANKKSLIDFTDVFTGGQAINAITHLDPGGVATAAGMLAIKNLIKKANSPDRAISKMFSDVEKSITKQSTIATLTPPKLGELNFGLEWWNLQNKKTMPFPEPGSKNMLSDKLRSIGGNK